MQSFRVSENNQVPGSFTCLLFYSPTTSSNEHHRPHVLNACTGIIAKIMQQLVISSWKIQQSSFFKILSPAGCCLPSCWEGQGQKAAALSYPPKAQYTPMHTQRSAVETYESSAFLAWSPSELTQPRSSSSGIWAFRLQSVSRRFINSPCRSGPLSASGTRTLAFYRLCFNCWVNIGVGQMQSRRVRQGDLLAAHGVDEKVSRSWRCRMWGDGSAWVSLVFSLRRV